MRGGGGETGHLGSCTCGRLGLSTGRFVPPSPALVTLLHNVADFVPGSVPGVSGQHGPRVLDARVQPADAEAVGHVSP